MPALPARLAGLGLVALFAFATCSSGPEPPSNASAGAAADSTAWSDGGAVRLGEPAKSRLLAEDSLWARALALHYDAIVADGHIDTPSLMLDDAYALGERHMPLAGSRHVDLPKMIEGGLDAPFSSIYVARSYGEGPAATERARAMIAELERQVEGLDGIEMATSTEDVLRITRSGKKAALMGLEGGHALQGSKEVLRDLRDRGIRYVTLTHSNTNSWADAATDTVRWGGLNGLGRELVREMNRLGVLVDLSHVSDSTFYDALAVTEAPVILSHSSVRALTAHPRNVTDAMLRALAENGGVIMINFYPRYIATGGSPRADLDALMAHVEHAIEVAGIDHVGLGSDFDGVPSLPAGMEDATRLPWITYELLRRGYSEADVRKVLGGNALRVLREAERVAARMQGAG
ncbi:MAG: dipeptidase [Rhodothermales bacterium]|nr:dipeptidase [Rhodothermales bacterium]